MATMLDNNIAKALAELNADGSCEYRVMYEGVSGGADLMGWYHEDGSKFQPHIYSYERSNLAMFVRNHADCKVASESDKPNSRKLYYVPDMWVVGGAKYGGGIGVKAKQRWFAIIEKVR